jgi:glycosyltransferase involved in cell wall biosynthesis
MKKGKLLVIHTPPPYGGGEVQAQNLKEYFAGKENYVIYDYSRKSHSRRQWNSLFDVRAILGGIWWVLKVVYLFLARKPEKVYFTLPKSFRAFMRNAMVIPVARLLGIKILGELPGTSFCFLEKGRGIFYRTGLFFLKQIDEIRFLSPRISDVHRGYRFRKHVIIENGIRAAAGHAVNPDVFGKSELNLLYVGSIERSKGIFNSLQALKLCLDEGHKMHFHVVGYWPNEKEEREAVGFIAENRLEKAVTFHGILIGAAKWDIVKGCAILLHPTFWDGVPLTILEALSVGMAVISTRVGGIPDTIQDGANGIILNENNPEAIKAALNYLNSKRNILSLISANNRALFEKRFSLPIFLKNMENWFND